MDEQMNDLNDAKPSAIYLGTVMHQRFFPVQYRFNYRVMSLRINVDTIEQEIEQGALGYFSLNRFNLYSVYFKDFGARDGKPWRPWLEGLLREYGVEQRPARIELVCSPRFMGIVFNPLAMWYAYNAEQKLIAVIGEVSNTFGQWHHYVLTNKDGALSALDGCKKLQAQADKVFHVSPFIDMDCVYQFRLQAPSEQFQLGIYQHQQGKKMLVATQAAKAVALTRKNLFKAALAMPFNSLKVLTMIHWWALKIWLKGGKFRTTPKALKNTNYSHTEMRLC
ncbi:DUF1365 domain-containing protein [Thiosulfatimonas sediminis]|uniref:DUF1365 domain-containing protein n=1 Tax=Thiosulfatimonas sediminis TaxID=2675054 RepID=A0A6F8PXE0_9GAMM|nr:DUF1365 domain-containing protein [Thiosulfatimonas sediminis]